MKFKNFTKGLLCSIIIASSITTMAAAKLTDVNQKHWAYTSIVNLESKGIIAYNSKGQFFPNHLMTFFELSDVMARAAGYVDVDTNKNVSAETKKQITANYEKQKGILAEYAKKYKNWNKKFDKQIAYLLGKGIVTKEDLTRFMSNVGGKEYINRPTKEDICVWIVRLLGKEEAAKAAYKGKTGFNDELKIAEANRPAVTYLKELGIIAPDANGNSNTTMKLSKALCAKMVDSALKTTTQASAQKPDQTTTSAAVTPVDLTIVKGRVVDKVENDIIRIELEDGSSKSYIINDNCIVILNGNKMLASDINENYIATLNVQNDKVVKIQAKTQAQNTTNNEADINKVVSTKGTIDEIVLAATPKLTLDVNGEKATYKIGSEAKLYDNFNKKYITVKDLYIGQAVSVVVQNGEIISLDVQK